SGRARSILGLFLGPLRAYVETGFSIGAVRRRDMRNPRNDRQLPASLSGSVRQERPDAGRAGDRPPDVSVVIPTRNREGLLPTALASALGQTDVAVEVIVVDDASTDRTRELLAQLADPRLRVVRLKTRLGV